MNERAPTRAPLAPLFGAVARPIVAFFRLEAASGIVLLAAAVGALAWVNLGGAAVYQDVLGTELALGAGGAVARFTLLQLVNDGLMTVFFFVVGMEIKRELAVGELRRPAQAALPAIAALGGMIVPAAVFLAFNAGGPGARGWGIPMATDIAFSIGVLALLGRRVPHALAVFLTALAIFDDIGGILVIALFYGHGLDARWLVAAAVAAAGLWGMSRAFVRSWAAWAAGGALLWWALHHAGIHATIAGVVLGLAIPARPRRRPREVLARLGDHVGGLLATSGDDELDSEALLRIEDSIEDLEAPLARFEHALHPWVAFGVMPLFALANSGVVLGGGEGVEPLGEVAVGTAAALFAGKQVGIFAFAAGAVRLGLAPMPGGASYAKLLGVAIVAGIGFTVSLFIASLAFASDPALLAQAKIGILVGSLAAGVVGALVLRVTAEVRPATA
ncbi:Na+/H+ antiporter NhaA [Anaeromyxobacter terrae]|uniref:Na+/H+ antiporter NhaA n=1 Tax=Anaeromyxobacter terrae TaxID=2925406 RepID=UPI001F5944E3|nr:Na+/H+ antiporter NhaA [Anaeromyxobacter sp. SG22]